MVKQTVIHLNKGLLCSNNHPPKKLLIHAVIWMDLKGAM